jgi:hypothetical protein
MQKLPFTLLLLTGFLPCGIYAQLTINGRVLDSLSHEPMPLASVFCQNTTVGTATNKAGEFRLELKSGGYDLVVSYTGYQTQVVRVTGAENGTIDILMVKQDKSLSEVIVRNSTEVKGGWEKYGDFFIENFIGTSPNARECKLLNKDALKFFYYKRTNKLKILATEALQIENKALGYSLHYQLDSFVYYYNSDISSYRGFCLFTEMIGPDPEKKAWASNRLTAYYGSKLHFMRSIYDSSLEEEGWEIAMLNENDNTKFSKVINPYDTLYYTAVDSSNQTKIWFPRKLSITYMKGKPEQEYLRKYELPANVGLQISYVNLLDAILIRENGYYFDQKNWISQGYWSWKNIGDQLPYDYLPD